MLLRNDDYSSCLDNCLEFIRRVLSIHRNPHQAIFISTNEIYRDTSALSEMFQYSTLVEILDQCNAIWHHIEEPFKSRTRVHMVWLKLTYSVER